MSQSLSKSLPSRNSLKKNTESERVIDDGVLALLKNRDATFLKTIFVEVNPYLSRICFANGIQKSDVNELIHQTWEKFFSNLEKFEGRSQIRTFICGILFNKIREHRREQKRYVSEEDADNFLENSFTLEGWWKHDPGDPLKIAELKQSTEFIKECLEGLTEQQKTAFLMKEVEDEETVEVCNVLGVNASHLRVLIFRAKDKLKKCLEGKIGTEEVLNEKTTSSNFA